MMECHQQFSLRRHLHFLTQPLFLLVITNSRTLKIANHHTKGLSEMMHLTLYDLGNQ